MGKIIDAGRFKCNGISSADAARNLNILSWAFAQCSNGTIKCKKTRVPRKLKKKYKKLGIYEYWKSGACVGMDLAKGSDSISVNSVFTLREYLTTPDSKGIHIIKVIRGRKSNETD